MGTGYTRNDTSNNIADGNVINASDLDGEFDAVESAFNSSSGHTHDGTSAEGAPITVLGPVQDFVASATEIKPKTDNTLDIGTSSLEFKDLYLDGKAYIDGLGENLLVDTDKSIQFRDTALTINSSTNGQLDINADVELEITAPTVDIDASTAVTIDTTTLTITGSANVAGDLDVDNININGNTIISTDSNGNIALTPNGTGEVDISKVDIDSGAIDGTVIGANSAAAGTFTNLTSTGTSTHATVDINGGAIDAVTIGTNSAVTDLRVDNLKLDGNTISSTDSNGDITIDPDGTGVIDVPSTTKVQFRDSGLFINSSTNGQLDIDADAELEITAPIVDIDASTSVNISNDLKLDSDSAILSFGADSEITVTHEHNTGLKAKAASGFELNLQTSHDSIEATDVIGKITFNAPDESSGTDAILDGAAIEAVAEATFASDNNATALVFKTNTSAAATERMRIKSDGTIVMDTQVDIDNITIDGNTISSTDSNGNINLSPNGTGTVIINTDLDVDNININGNAITSTDSNGNIAITPNGTGEVDISKVDIDSGAIDGTVIGANSAAAGTFTTLTATTLSGALNLNSQALTNVDINSGSIDGTTIGANSAADGTFTAVDVDNINVNGNTISSTNSNGDITLDPNGTGHVVIPADIGIGTTSPSARIHIEAATPTIRLEDTNANGYAALSANNTRGGLTLQLDPDDVDSSTDFRVQVDGTEVIRVDANGLLFNGDSAAANALDDYEEGTWTVGATTSSGTAASFGSEEGFYTKIGRQVTATAIITNITPGGTAASPLRINGLPFNPNTHDAIGSAIWNDIEFQGASRFYFAPRAVASGNYIEFRQAGDTSSHTALDHGDLDNGNISDITFTITYVT
tara:strand:+ start:3921 stop:6530 length:2610 start_codon:yes stop_codon:yes gene_type:complete